MQVKSRLGNSRKSKSTDRSLGQGNKGQNKLGQFKSKWVNLGQVKVVQVKSGQDKLGHVKSVQVDFGQFKSGQVK